MENKINMVRTIKGTHDILPAQSGDWQDLETQIHKTANLHGYDEIRTPIIENAALFNRGVGEETDIVSKEMYSWIDKDKSTISLRPELTAPVARAYVQHNLGGQSLLQRLYYIGPSFRRERPQKGRQRQFHQFGVEAIGSDNPEQDAEVISIGWSILNSFGINELELNISSIGSEDCRTNYRQELINYLKPFIPQLSEVSQHRLKHNPLRILDTKNKDEIKIIASAPKIDNFYTKEDEIYFLTVQQYLDDLEIPYKINPLLVRGLDYYTQTTFEISSKKIGAQDALLGGGRYDGLIKSLGGNDVPAVGFAAGMERILIAADNRKRTDKQLSCIYIVCTDLSALGPLQQIAKNLRDLGIKVILETLRRSMKAQMREANKRNANYAIIVGEQEAIDKTVQLKNLNEGAQDTVNQNELISYFKSLTF